MNTIYILILAWSTGIVVPIPGEFQSAEECLAAGAGLRDQLVAINAMGAPRPAICLGKNVPAPSAQDVYVKNFPAPTTTGTPDPIPVYITKPVQVQQ
jgi:hypothetical protein